MEEILKSIPEEVFYPVTTFVFLFLLAILIGLACYYDGKDKREGDRKLDKEIKMLEEEEKRTGHARRMVHLD